MALTLHSDHARLFEHNRFVYPVLSRRSGGISIGVNLNPDKICNFDCIYCQVDRRSAERDAVRGDRRAAGRAAGDARIGVVGGASTRRRSFAGVPAALAAAQRHRLLRRRRADDVQEFRRADGAVCGGEARRPGLGRCEDGADHQRQHVPPAARPARARRSSTATTARSGPSSTRGPTSTITSSNGRRFRFGRFSTTSRRRRACGRW